MEIDPDDADIHNDLGLALEKNNMNDRAIEEFNKAISINPNHEKAINNLKRIQENIE